MGFALPGWEERKKELFEKEHIQFRDNRIHVSELGDKTVNHSMYEEMVMNSYARDKIFPKLTTLALIEVAEHYMDNASRPRTPCATYDEAIIHRILPEFIRRLKEEMELE